MVQPSRILSPGRFQAGFPDKGMEYCFCPSQAVLGSPNTEGRAVIPSGKGHLRFRPALRARPLSAYWLGEGVPHKKQDPNDQPEPCREDCENKVHYPTHFLRVSVMNRFPSTRFTFS
jgi:hypothetical protein